MRAQHDVNSPGPPPPAAVLVTGIPPLTPTQEIRRHLAAHGALLTFDPQIDKTTGAALGIAFVRYATHDEAKRCVAKEDGRRWAGGVSSAAGVGAGAEGMRVVFDGEGKVLRAVLRELDEQRRRREREAKKRKEEKERPTQQTQTQTQPSSSSSREPAASSARAPGPAASASATPKTINLPPGLTLPVNPWRHTHPFPAPHPHPHPHAHPHPHPHARAPAASTSASSSTAATPHASTLPPPIPSLPPKPATPSQLSVFPGSYPLQPMAPRVRRPPASLVRARIMSTRGPAPLAPLAHQAHHLLQQQQPFGDPSTPYSAGSTPLPPRHRGRAWDRERDDHWSPRTRTRSHSRSRTRTRSPSPVPRRAAGDARRSETEQQKRREGVLEELARNGFDYVRVDGHGGQLLGGAVREEEVRALFEGFRVDKVRCVSLPCCVLLFFRGGREGVAVSFLVCWFVVGGGGGRVGLLADAWLWAHRFCRTIWAGTSPSRRATLRGARRWCSTRARARSRTGRSR